LEKVRCEAGWVEAFVGAGIGEDPKPVGNPPPVSALSADSISLTNLVCRVFRQNVPDAVQL